MRTPSGSSAVVAPLSARTIVVTGPTASGKTRLAVQLARQFGGRIVSADSRQVYRGLDLGTGKDLHEYGTGIDAVPYHLIDIADPTEEYHLFRYLQDARAAIMEIDASGACPIVAGGTSLYINALLDGYTLDGGGIDMALREELAGHSDEQLQAILAAEAPDVLARTDTTQRHRILRAVEIARSRSKNRGSGPRGPGLAALILAPYYQRHEIHARIASRLDARLAAGMVAEVRRLHESGVSWERMEWLGLEYRYISRHLRGLMDAADMRNVLLARIRRFCRSQDIWFRKMEREGKVIHWLPEGELQAGVELVEQFLAGQPLPEPRLRLMDIRYGPRGKKH